MSGNYKKEDLRIFKTKKSLVKALYTILNKRPFEKVTVNELCEEALVSRAAFYAHYNDKYDLLKSLLTDIRKDIVEDFYQYNKLETTVNKFIAENSRLISNLIIGANNETLDLIHALMFDIFNIAVAKKNGKLSRNQETLVDFCAGGIITMLTWQVRNKFPEDFKFMNSYFYSLLICMIEWDAAQND